MRGRRLVRRGAVLVAALAVGVAGAVGAVPPPTASAEEEVTPVPTPGMAVPVAKAGELRLWGDNTFDQATVPASLRGVAVSQVVFPNAAGLALTADGRVIGWGGNIDRLQQVPAEVTNAKVAQIAGGTQGSGYAGAVTRDGRVLTWGKRRAFPTPLNVPAGLSGVKQLAITQYSAAALKQDGSVVAWGLSDFGEADVPEGLKATAITAEGSRFVALTEQGTVVTWGSPVTGGLPASVQIPGNVKAIASSNNVSLALLADNTLVALGSPAPPTEFLATDPLLLANGGHRELAVVDRDWAIHYWHWEDSLGVRPPGEIPAELNGLDLAQITLGSSLTSSSSYPAALTGGVIVTKMLRATSPRVTGTARVGSRLTATPGTFSASPEAVTGQWRANGVPISGATGTTLTVTKAMAGKQISYSSTATKAGEASVTSTSNSTARVPVPAPAKVGSRTSIRKVMVARKARKVTVIGKVTASRSRYGKARMIIKKGRKTLVARTVRVSSAGNVKSVVRGLGRIAQRKTRNWRGKYRVTLRYYGNSRVKPSTGARTFTVRR
jgi:hypothetical protein